MGVITIENTKKLMGGPLESVETKADRYVVLEPGVIKKSVVAYKLSKVFNIPVSSVERVLPPGDVNVAKTVGFKI